MYLNKVHTEPPFRKGFDAVLHEILSKLKQYGIVCLIYRNIKNKQDQILCKILNGLCVLTLSKHTIMKVSLTRDPEQTGQVLEEVKDAKYWRLSLSNDL